MSKEIALDLKRYDTPEKLSSLIFDTASLAIEAADSGIPRVNPHFFVKKGENHVIAPGKDKRDISEMFVKGDSATDAALEIRKRLLEEKGNFSYVWISPPDPWPEARIQVGTKKNTPSKRFEYLKMYDISLSSLSKDECLKLGQLLVSVSPERMEYPEDTDSLRQLVIGIQIPGGQDPFEYLSKLIELRETGLWESILDGTADKNKVKVIKAAVTATLPVRLNPSIIYSAPREYGVYVETRMRYEGYGMNPARFGCGSSNITLTTNGFSYTETLTLNLGHEDQYGSLNFSCPKCGATNTRPFGRLISNCQRCGRDVRC